MSAVTLSGVVHVESTSSLLYLLQNAVIVTMPAAYQTETQDRTAVVMCIMKKCALRNALLASCPMDQEQTVVRMILINC